jgi:DNA excision repair protein ERCC-4
MLLPLGEDIRHSRGDLIVKQLSTRLAGGGRIIEKDPPRVIIDVREMNSALPNLLHASGMVVIPLTLTVGDYILSPDICVERKSIPDLVQSFNNGRLYVYQNAFLPFNLYISLAQIHSVRVYVNSL